MVNGGAWPRQHPVTQVRFQGHPRAKCQGEDTVAEDHHSPSAWSVWRVQQTLRFGDALEL